MIRETAKIDLATWQQFTAAAAKQGKHPYDVIRSLVTEYAELHNPQPVKS